MGSERFSAKATTDTHHTRLTPTVISDRTNHTPQVSDQYTVDVGLRERALELRTRHVKLSLARLEIVALSETNATHVPHGAWRKHIYNDDMIMFYEFVVR